MNVGVSLVLQLLFVTRTLKNVFVGIFRDAARCKWGKVAVMVWAEDGLRRCGWLMLWSSQRSNTNQGRIGPKWNLNIPTRGKGTLNSAYTLLH